VILSVALYLALFAGLLVLSRLPFWNRGGRRPKECLPAPVPVAAFNILQAAWTLPQPRISFNAERHEYRAEDGTRLPSVTEILKRVGIIDTAGFSRKAADFGTSVHQATAAIDRGERSLEDYAAEDPRQPYLKAWELFKRLRVSQVLCVEQIVGSLELGCAGTLDRLVLLKGGGAPVVLDLKTGKERLWHRAQLGGYVVASGRPYRRMAVYLHENGYANGIEFKEERDLRAFQSALEWVREGNA
jgi:hypothetical protein